MRIAIVAEVFLPKIDGVVGRTVNLIQQLLANGDEVIVVCPKVEEYRNSPVPLIEFPSFPCASYPEYAIGRPDQRLIQELKAFRPDVIHFLNPFAFGFQCYDLLCRSDLQLPVLFSFHTLYGEFVKQYPGLGMLSRLLWWLMKSYHNTADRNLTVSNFMADDLRKRGFERVALWPPAVDCNLYNPERKSAAMRCRLSGNHPDSPLLLTVSRLASEKNVSFLTEVLERVPEATLAIVGGGPQRDELVRRFSRYKAHFVGYLRGEELAAAYASADAFVYASETETMGNVILEAMACGLPVIAADAGGVTSLVRHGSDGFLFTPRNSPEASQYVRQIIESPIRREQMSATALASVQKRTWKDSSDEVRLQYQQVISEFQRLSPSQMAVRRPVMRATIVTQILVGLFHILTPRTRSNLPQLQTSAVHQPTSAHN